MACLRCVIFAGLVAGAGCQNNTIALDEDVGTGGDASGNGSGSAGDGMDDGRPTTGVMDTGVDVDTGSPGRIEDGWWLMAVDTPLSPGLPIQFLVQVLEVSPGAYNVALQSLSLDIGSTTAPRQPVGDVHVIGGLPLGGGAPLQFYTGVIDIPGAANPITGSDLTIDIYVDGMQIGDPFCGAVSGAVVAPIESPLTGSTFATTRLAATDPASLPIDFPVTCP